MEGQEREKAPYRGKGFYLLLLAFVLMILLVFSVSLYVCLRSFKTAGAQAGEALDVAMRSYDLYLQSINDGMNLDDMTAFLNRDGAISVLVVGADEEAGEALRMRLVELANSEFDGNGEYYIYFLKRDFLLGAGSAILDARAYDSSGVQEMDFIRLFEDAGDETGISFLRENTFGKMQIIQAKRLSDEVLVIADCDPPTLPNIDALTPLFKNAELYFIDRNDNAFAFQEQDSLIGRFTYAELALDGDTILFQREFDGVPYRCYAHNAVDGYMKFALFTKDVAAIEQERLTTLIVATCIALVLFGGLAAFWITKRIYKPVQDLISKIPCGEYDRERDEFRLITGALMKMESQLNAQKKLLQRFRLLRMLRGQQNTNLEELDVGDNASCFAVAALRAEANHEGEATWADLQRMENLLLSYGIDCARPQYTTSDGGFLLAVLPLTDNDITAVSNYLERFRLLSEEREGILLSAYISRIHDSAGELNAAYNEVLEIAEYQAIMEEFNVVVCHDSLQSRLDESGSRSDSILREQRLQAAVKTLNIETALRLYDEVVEEITQKKPLSLLRIRVNSLRESLILALYETDALRADLSNTAYAERMSTAKNTVKLREALEVALYELQGVDGRATLDDEAFAQIMAFVREHYRDPSFSASVVARHFSMSQSGVTRAFKRMANMGFLEYVHALRIEKAKELLLTTDRSVSEISILVGYTNTLTMTRAFKRYTGTTPGSFREK